MKKIFCLAIVIVAFVYTNFAQNITMESYQKAREVFDKSLEAYGGLEDLRGIQNLSLKIEGFEFHRNQSRRPDIVEQTSRSYQVILDLKNNRYRIFIERGGIGRDATASYDVFDGKERISALMQSKTKRVRQVAANWREQYSALFLPQFVMLNASKRMANLRYLGKVNFNDRPHEIIVIQTAEGTQLSLYVDAETYLLSKEEELISDSLMGDAITETIFSNYRTAGKFKIPSEVITKIADTTTSRLNYLDVSFDKNLTEAEFKLEFDLISQPPTQNAPPIQKLGENIYTVTVSGYRVLFINFKDHIWVMEAPVGDAAAQEAISKIKETIPNKPIKYLALTHHHADHTAGVRTYIAEGSTLVTTKGNRSYFEQMAKSRFTISPDTLTRNPQPLKMEFVENGKRVFTDGVTTVELYDIGPSPHAEEMLIAYLPKEKILFEADMFDAPLDDRFVSTVHLVKWIEQKSLVVEQIVPVHGTITTLGDVLKSIAERQRTQK